MKLTKDQKHWEIVKKSKKFSFPWQRFSKVRRPKKDLVSTIDSDERPTPLGNSKKSILFISNLFFNLCAKTSGSTFFPTSHKSGQWKAWILKEKAENKNVSWVHSALYLTVLECWTSWSLKGQEETSQLSGLFWRLTWKYTSFWWLPLSAKKKKN